MFNPDSALGFVMKRKSAIKSCVHAIFFKKVMAELLQIKKIE